AGVSLASPRLVLALGDAVRPHVARARAVHAARPHPVSRPGAHRECGGVARWPGAQRIGSPARRRRARRVVLVIRELESAPAPEPAPRERRALPATSRAHSATRFARTWPAPAPFMPLDQIRIAAS